MQADFSVELGQDDESLEVPWAAEAGGPMYYDLKRHPELLAHIEEAATTPELRHFLSAINAPAGPLETAKCDSWFSTEMSAEEEIFGAKVKFGCYVDLLFSGESERYSFPQHEQWAQRLVQLLKKAPEISASAEFLIRRCYFHLGETLREGFYVTFYCFGYGVEEIGARQNWAIGLRLVENAIRQVAV